MKKNNILYENSFIREKQIFIYLNERVKSTNDRERGCYINLSNLSKIIFLIEKRHSKKVS